MESVSVKCPHCHKQAIVTCEGYPHHRTLARVICRECGYNEIQTETSWKGSVYGYVRRRCPNCGEWLEKHLAGPKHQYLAELECPRCHFKLQDKIEWYRVYSVTPHDPFFGLPLWFVCVVGEEVLWAYNRAHLVFIKNYVEAKLRHRVANQNGSLVSRLPEWIKRRKNRGRILKAIKRMEMWL